MNKDEEILNLTTTIQHALKKSLFKSPDYQEAVRHIALLAPLTSPLTLYKSFLINQFILKDHNEAMFVLLKIEGSFLWLEMAGEMAEVNCCWSVGGNAFVRAGERIGMVEREGARRAVDRSNSGRRGNDGGGRSGSNSNSGGNDDMNDDITNDINDDINDDMNDDPSIDSLDEYFLLKEFVLGKEKELVALLKKGKDFDVEEEIAKFKEERLRSAVNASGTTVNASGASVNASGTTVNAHDSTSRQTGIIDGPFEHTPVSYTELTLQSFLLPIPFAPLHTTTTTTTTTTITNTLRLFYFYNAHVLYSNAGMPKTCTYIKSKILRELIAGKWYAEARTYAEEEGTRVLLDALAGKWGLGDERVVGACEGVGDECGRMLVEEIVRRRGSDYELL